VQRDEVIVATKAASCRSTAAAPDPRKWVYETYIERAGARQRFRGDLQHCLAPDFLDAMMS